MNFSIVNLGCKVNRVESDSAALLLSALGATQSAPGDADLIVVNTCTVTGEAEKKTRKAVRGALRANDHALVVVTGCASAVRPEAFQSLSHRIRVVSKGMLEQKLRAFVSTEPAAVTPGDRALLLRYGGEFPTRVGVKVQDGCNNACTYCIVHVARGRAWGREPERIVQECVSYARAGVKEIVLTGINLGSYAGADAAGSRVPLALLLSRLLEATENVTPGSGRACRFRISSVEPRDIDQDVIDLLAQGDGRLCRHLHLPLQSGSSRVLREMARPYDASYYRQLVDELYQRIPALSLSTDIIVGFPGETEQDFDDTLEMARYAAFSKIHVFPYSKREGTPAAARADQIPVEVKNRRAALLREEAQRLRNNAFLQRVGSMEWVVVERKGVGMTESYFEIPVDDSLPVGSTVQRKLITQR